MQASQPMWPCPTPMATARFMWTTPWSVRRGLQRQVLSERAKKKSLSVRKKKAERASARSVDPPAFLPDLETIARFRPGGAAPLTRIGPLLAEQAHLTQLLLFHGLMTVPDAMYGLLAFNCGPINNQPKNGLIILGLSVLFPDQSPKPSPRSARCTRVALTGTSPTARATHAAGGRTCRLHEDRRAS